uniref:Uncharacterized protein n=1 Tax=Anguilla anguilla TaxID=7936 RepID=A0A0E9QHU3_ANGAN
MPHFNEPVQFGLCTVVLLYCVREFVAGTLH